MEVIYRKVSNCRCNDMYRTASKQPQHTLQLHISERFTLFTIDTNHVRCLLLPLALVVLSKYCFTLSYQENGLTNISGMISSYNNLVTFNGTSNVKFSSFSVFSQSPVLHCDIWSIYPFSKTKILYK